MTLGLPAALPLGPRFAITRTEQSCEGRRAGKKRHDEQTGAQDDRGYDEPVISLAPACVHEGTQDQQKDRLAASNDNQGGKRDQGVFQKIPMAVVRRKKAGGSLRKQPENE